MNKKSVLAMIVIILLFLLPLKGDWKEDVRDYFQKAHEYENIVKYLETRLKNIPEKEKPLAIIILCYAYGEMGDVVNEEKWAAELFENYDPGDPDFVFLSRSEGVKIYEYLQQWKRRYPGIKTITINKQSQRIRYFSHPGKFYLDIETSAPCEITILDIDNQRAVIYAGYLTRGSNTIGFLFAPQLKRHKETLLEMVLKSGTVERKKRFILEAAYHYPEAIKFEPKEGKIAIIGKEFKQEISEEISHKTQRYFDKKSFKKKAVPYLAIGVALYLLDVLVVKKTINRESSEPGTKALMNGIDKAATVLAIGISLKGLVHVFRSFKKEKKETLKTITDPDAVQHNNALRREIQKVKENIFVTYRLREVKGRRQKTEDRGQKTEDRGQRTEDRGQRTEDRGQRTEDRGQRTEDRGQKTEDRGQRTEDRGQRTEDRGQRTEDRGQRTEDRGQKTEDRGQRTEDRGQRTEDRGQRTEDGRQRKFHGDYGMKGRR